MSCKPKTCPKQALKNGAYDIDNFNLSVLDGTEQELEGRISEFLEVEAIHQVDLK